ncbi:MAG: Na/Pi cotransporter family protein [Peptoniphilaceae bacterium]|jgi:Na/Pi-cotransporter
MLVAAGVFAFLFGMNLMAKSLQKLDHTVLKRWITSLSKRPWLSFLCAAFAAFIVQSSSVITVLIIGLVAGNMIALPQAFMLLLGANIGTAVQIPFLRNVVEGGFIVAGLFAFFLWMLATRTDQKNVALSIIGTALVFTGLDQVVIGLGALPNYVWFTETMRTMRPGVSAFFNGVTLTTLLQSSGISLRVLTDFLREGAIALPAAMYFMLGANIGTTSTAMISTIGGDIDAKRTGVLHVLINVFGVLLLWPVFAYMMHRRMLVSLPYPTDWILMRAHLVFNLLTSFLFIPLTGPFLRLVRFLVPSPMERRTEHGLTESLAEETPLLLLHADLQALYRNIWAYTKQVFHLFQTMDVHQLERAAQISESIRQTGSQLRKRFYHETKGSGSKEPDSELLRLIGFMEDMGILHELVHEVFLLASDRIMHQRKIDEISRMALRSQFKKTLDMVYLCAQLGKRDAEEVAQACWNQEELGRERPVFQRNVLMAAKDGRLDEKSAEDLLAVFRLLERINLAGRILLDREEQAL